LSGVTQLKYEEFSVSLQFFLDMPKELYFYTKSHLC
jgi:hypothetical protein